MTREILFRGFHESVNGDVIICVDGRTVRGKWMCGYFWLNDTATRQTAHITDNDGNIYVVIPATVGQYTGKDDENGNKIFDGDIVRTNLDYNLHEVDYVYDNWYAHCYINLITEECEHLYEYDDVKVVGTIFDLDGGGGCKTIR